MKTKFNKYIKKGGANAPAGNAPTPAPGAPAANATPQVPPPAANAPAGNAGKNIPPIAKNAINKGFDMASKAKQFEDNMTGKTNRAMNSMARGMGKISNKTSEGISW